MMVWMKLYEYQGKELFKKYGIVVPDGFLVKTGEKILIKNFPVVLKAQILQGNRLKNGGVKTASILAEAEKIASEFFFKNFNGEKPDSILVEEKISAQREFYLSFSYSTDVRAPILIVKSEGGTGISSGSMLTIDLRQGPPKEKLEKFLGENDFLKDRIKDIIGVVEKLWQLFTREYALLAEINPLAETPSGLFALDAKVIIDDAALPKGPQPVLELGGDIAVLASGGGASMLNIDALLSAAGRPANYAEYSGNPPAEIVADLTQRVLSRPGLKGAWVVGGIANFTDIFETMLGFTRGLARINPKPEFPIVIRRDGPRQKEAFEMLRKFAQGNHFDFYLYGSEISMVESAKIIVEKSYSHR